MTAAPRQKVIRHALDQRLVAESIEREVARIERLSRRHGGGPFYDVMIAAERALMGTAHVVELPRRKVWRFLLVRGEDDIEGTGPFMTLEEAAQWFYKDGR